MLPPAVIVHQLPQRVRLRVDEKRNDDEYFDSLIESLSSMGSITRFHTNRTVGSIVLVHEDTDWPIVHEELEKAQLFTIVDGPERQTPPAMAPLITRMKHVNRNLDEASLGSLDLQTTAFISLMLLTLHQAFRGQVLGPALPMLLHAWSILSKYKPEPGNAENE